VPENIFLGNPAKEKRTLLLRQEGRQSRIYASQFAKAIWSKNFAGWLEEYIVPQGGEVARQTLDRKKHGVNTPSIAGKKRRCTEILKLRGGAGVARGKGRVSEERGDWVSFLGIAFSRRKLSLRTGTNRRRRKGEG